MKHIYYRSAHILRGALLAAFALFALAGSAAVAQPAGQVYALTENQQAVCEAIGSDDSCKADPTGGKGLNATIKQGIDIFSAILGIIAVVMIMIAGYKYITSSGDSTKVSSAKNTLVYAVIGLIIVALSQTIVKYVVGKLT